MEPQVKITQDVSDNLLATLRENDQQFATINPKEFRGALEKYLTEQWGSPKCRHFTGQNGQPSWVVDLSEALGGFVYYAVIGASGGVRSVAGFVDEDSVAHVVGGKTEPMSTTKDPSEPTDEQAIQRIKEEAQAREAEHLEYVGLAEDEIVKLKNENAGLQNEIGALRSQVELLAPRPEDPVLVRHKVVDSKEKGGEVEAKWVTILSTHEAVEKCLADLFDKGVKASAIEIWGRKSVPRVKIEW